MTNLKTIYTAFFLTISSFLAVAQSAISPVQFQEKIEQTNAIQLVDVRTAGEFVGGWVKGAINIDIRSKNFAENIVKLKKNEPVFVYCLSGGRSGSAARKLSNLGYTEVYDLKGGMMAWKRAGLPVQTNSANAKPAGTTKASYDKLVNSNIPVLVNFYAPWCGPCRKMKPMLAELENEAKGKFTFLKLNADNEDALMKALDVSEIPTFFIYKNGKLSWQHVGLVEKSLLIQKLGL